MDWKQKIEAQIAQLRSDYRPNAADTLQALLDVAVAVDEYMTYGPLHAEFGGDIAHNRLSHALDKLKEVGNE